MRVGAEQGLLTGAQAAGLFEKPNGNPGLNYSRVTAANIGPRIYPWKIAVPTHLRICAFSPREKAGNIFSKSLKLAMGCSIHCRRWLAPESAGQEAGSDCLGSRADSRRRRPWGPRHGDGPPCSKGSQGQHAQDIGFATTVVVCRMPLSATVSTCTTGSARWISNIAA
jgi:hypothetical protein